MRRMILFRFVIQGECALLFSLWHYTVSLPGFVFIDNNSFVAAFFFVFL